MNKKIKIVQNVAIPVLVSVILTGGLTFAWNAVWHGTSWIQSGRVITPRELAEYIEYLKQKLDALQIQVNSISSSTSSSTINNVPAGTVVAGCFVYGLNFSWNSSCWGGATVNNSYSRVICPAGTTAINITNNLAGNGVYNTNGLVVGNIPIITGSINDTALGNLILCHK